MKSILNIRGAFLKISLLLIVILQIQCKKELISSAEVAIPGSVVVSVMGLDDFGDNVGKLASKGLSDISNSFEFNKQIKLTKDVELSTSSYSEPLESILESTHPIDAGVSSKVQSKVASTNPMGTNKLYRIIFTNGNKVYDFINSANKTLVAQLEIGESYSWYAYSYNDNLESDFEELPLDLKIKALVDKDLLFAQGTVTTTNSTTEAVKIQIQFVHKVARLSFKVDANALWGELENFEAELIEIGGISNLNTVFKSGQLDLKDGSVDIDPNSIVISKDLDYLVSDNKKTAEAPSFFTTSLENINSVKIKVKAVSRKRNGNIEDILSSSLESDLTFNFPTAAAYGKNHISRIVLKSIFPQMTIMHTDSNYARYGFTPMNHLFLATYEGILGTRPSGPGGFLMTHFVPEGVNPNYRQYFPNKLKMEAEHIHLNAFNNKTNVGTQYKYGAETIAARLKAVNKPDFVFLSNYLLYPSQEDIDELINYVKNGGTVIVTADRGMIQGGAYNNPKWVWRDSRLIEFFREVFPAAPGKTVEVKQYQSSDLTTPLDKYEFKINSSINDQITNGYFGDVRANYWGSFKHITYLTGIDPNGIVSYSSAVPRSGYSNANNIPSDAQIMIRSKQYNVIFIGNTYFPNAYFVDGPGLSVETHGNDAVAYTNINHTSANNGYALNATPITSTARGVKTDNSRLYANMIVWAMDIAREKRW